MEGNNSTLSNYNFRELGEIMAIYAISDLHLSFAKPKPMDIFSDVWANHAEKVRQNWDSLVSKDDTVLMPGDLSWAIRLSEAKPDLNFVAARPGRKIMVRGNHDYWWQRRATSRIQRSINRNITLLQGTSVMVGDVGITGTRGWRVDQGVMAALGQNEPEEEGHSEKILNRELAYLENGLRSIPESARLKIAMLHYPPFDERLKPNEFAELLTRYSVDILVYGHVHLGSEWLEGDVNGVQYRMVSADVVNFMPQLIVP